MNASQLIATYGRVWAMMPERLQEMFQALRNEPASGPGRLRNSAPRTKAPKLPSVVGDVAMIPIIGTITQRSGGWMGGASTQQIGRQLAKHVADPNVGAIVLDVDSPGGSVYGVAELAAQVRAARQQKPVYAVANSLAASAAYYVASAASKLYVTPSGQVGSIGVWTAHVDMSKALEEGGYAVTLISAGKYKVEGHPYAPLDDEARAAIQSEVDGYYEMFLADVATNRGIKVAQVRADYGEGRVLSAKDAQAAGMVDGISSMDELMGSLAEKAQGKRRLAAARVAIAAAE